MGESNGSPPPASRTLSALATATRVRKSAGGGAELAEVQIPLVEGVKGMDDGYLFGEGIPWGGEQWDLIIHPKPEGADYSVRQAGKDEDTGFIISVPKTQAAKLILEHGFVFNRKNPLPRGAEDGRVILAQDKHVTYLMSLPAFIDKVMDLAGIEADEQGPVTQVDADEEGDGDALAPT